VSSGAGSTTIPRATGPRLAAAVRARLPFVVPIVGATVAVAWVLAPTTEDRAFALGAVLVAALAGISVSLTGVFGGVLVPGLLLLDMDALVSSSVPESIIEPAVAAIIVGIGIVVLVRVRPGTHLVTTDPPFGQITAIGGAAGLASGISGAGWGPIGVKLLILSGIEARHAIGSSLVGRGFMALAAIATYIAATTLTIGEGQWLIAIPLLGAALAGVTPGTILLSRLARRPAIIAVAVVSMALALPTLVASIW
jgi:uncharacterized membrane protein YfcA